MAGGHKSRGFLPEVVEAFQIMDQRCYQPIERGLPANVPDQWLFGWATTTMARVMARAAAPIFRNWRRGV